MANQAFVLFFADTGHTNLPQLNNLLHQGWRVKLVSAMSGTGETGPETAQSPYPFSRAILSLSNTGGASQQAFVVFYAGEGATNLAQLNGLLGQNWHIVQLVPMSGTGEHGASTQFPYSRALAILQRP